MSQDVSIIDPVEVRRFAADLRQTIKRLRDQQSAVRTHYGELEAVWKDGKFTRFNQVFGASLGRLRHFYDEAEMFAQYLERKAQAAERYLESGGYGR